MGASCSTSLVQLPSLSVSYSASGSRPVEERQGKGSAHRQAACGRGRCEDSGSARVGTVLAEDCSRVGRERRNCLCGESWLFVRPPYHRTRLFQGFGCCNVRDLPGIPVVALHMPFKCLDRRVSRKRQNDGVARRAGKSRIRFWFWHDSWDQCARTTWIVIVRGLWS